MSTTPEPEKFVRRPTVFEAMEWDGEYETVKKIQKWIDRPVEFHLKLYERATATLRITTSDRGVIGASLGEWVIKDRGTIKVIPADKLAELYAPAGTLLAPPEALAPKVEESPQSRLAREVKQAKEGGASPIVIVTPRRHGKTHVLLEEMLRDPEAVFVTSSTAAAEAAFSQYVELRKSKSMGQLISLGLPRVTDERHRFIAWHERVKQVGRNPRRRYLIDNADLILQINGTTPTMATFSDHNS